MQRAGEKVARDETTWGITKGLVGQDTNSGFHILNAMGNH